MEAIIWQNLLDQVRERPWVYLRRRSILYLDAFIEGMTLVWNRAHLLHDDLNVGTMRNWFRTKYGTDTNLDHVASVLELINERVGDEYKAFDEFFRLWDEFLSEERVRQSTCPWPRGSDPSA